MWAPSVLRYAGNSYSWNHARKSAEEAVLRFKGVPYEGGAGGALRNDIKTLLISKITGILKGTIIVI
jgi:hypothetical protein